jgi:hypothetical protein
MNVMPDAPAEGRFSDSVQYAFHLNSKATLAEAGDEALLVCTFDTATPQAATCTLTAAGNPVPVAVVTGDASATTGISTTGLKVFAGRRNDPFFFNLTGFRNGATTVRNAGEIGVDLAGCANALGSTADTIVGQLGTGTDGGTAVDDFSGKNVLSIVVNLDDDLITTGGALVGVWGSTHRKPVQQ